MEIGRHLGPDRQPFTGLIAAKRLDLRDAANFLNDAGKHLACGSGSV